jgi:hypothetical protein
MGRSLAWRLTVYAALMRGFSDSSAALPSLSGADIIHSHGVYCAVPPIRVCISQSEKGTQFGREKPEELDSFAASVKSADAAPTQQQYEVFQYLNGRLEEQLRKLDGVLSTDLAAFGEVAKRYNVLPLYVPDIKC